MTPYVLPVVFTALLWWFSTGLILYLDGLPRRTFGRSMTGATVLLAAALFGVAQTAGDAGAVATYLAFACGLMVWGWQEMSFLMGFITGPRRRACPPGASESRRFTSAVAAIVYHELAIAAGALLLAWMTEGAPNRFALWAYLLLWGMRLSAKLNLFLGVRNLSEDFLPEHLQYLRSFFRRRPMNLLFPVSVSVGTAVAVLLCLLATGEGVDPAAQAGFAMLATLMVLAVLEHWFMVLPLPVDALWTLGMRSRTTRVETPEAPLTVPARWEPPRARSTRRGG